MAPLPEAGVGGRQPVVPRVEKITEHSIKVEINEARPAAQQERLPGQHLFEGGEAARQFGQQGFLLSAPEFEATCAELALLVTKITEVVRSGDIFAPINIVELKGQRLDLAFYAAPENGLQPLQFRGKQAQAEFVIQVFREDLGVVIRFKNHFASVLENGNPVIALPGEAPDQ